MSKVSVTISRYNPFGTSYSPVKTEKIEQEEAEQLISYLNDCVHIRGFFEYQISLPGQPLIIKYTCISDAIGMIRANRSQRSK